MTRSLTRIRTTLPKPGVGVPGSAGGPGAITPYGLARRSIAAPLLTLLAVSASAPMVVLAGAVPATYAGTGVVAVPLSFPLLAAALGLFAVGFSRFSRDVPHAATFAALLTHGLGRAAGTAGAAVAVLSYNSVQIALYSLLGATAADQLGGPWWAWALAAWAIVAFIGFRGLALGGAVVAVVLSVEVGMIVLFDITALTHPAHTDLAAWVAPWRPDLLAVDGVGGVLAFAVASYLGFETTAAFGEEARNERSIGRAIRASLWFLGIFYGVSAWALAVAVGPDRIVDVARDPASGIPFSILATNLGSMGPIIADAGVTLLWASVIGAVIAPHQTVARYLYALGREQVLPTALARISTPRVAATGRHGRQHTTPAFGGVSTAKRTRQGGVPIAGSLTQSALSLAAILIAAVLGLDPIATLFTAPATLAALGLLTLMTATCIAVVAYYRSHGEHRAIRRHASTTNMPHVRMTRQAGPEPGADAQPGQDPGPWTRVVAPTLGGCALAAALGVTVANLGPTLADPSGVAPILLPVLIIIAALGGALRANWLRHHRPLVWQGLGHGRPAPLAVRDAAVVDLEL